MNNDTFHDPLRGPDEEPGHEHILEQVLIHLLTRPDLLDVVCEEATIPALVGEDGWPVNVTGVRPAQQELLTDQRGVVVDLSDGSSFAVLVQVLRQTREQTTVVAPE
jgi:hypothetical protein